MLVERQVGPDAGISFTRAGDVLLHGRSGPPLVVARDGTVICTLGGAAVADAAVAGELVVLSNGRVHSARTCERTLTIRGVERATASVIASGDGARVALVAGARATFVALPAGRVLSRVRHPSAIRELALDRDGGRAVTVAAGSAEARVWLTTSGRLERSLAGHVGDVVAAAVDRAGTVAATGSIDGQARVWDLATGAVLTVLSGHLNFVDTVGLTPDAAYVLTASPDRTARTWTSTGRLVSVLAGHTGEVTWASFVGAGATVVTGSADGTVRVWDAGTRPELVKAETGAPPEPVLVARSPDGSITARADGDSIRLAREDGTEIVLTGHRAPVTSVAFSPDGRRLVSASKDHDAIVWDAA